MRLFMSGLTFRGEETEAQGRKSNFMSTRRVCLTLRVQGRVLAVRLTVLPGYTDIQPSSPGLKIIHTCSVQTQLSLDIMAGHTEAGPVGLWVRTAILLSEFFSAVLLESASFSQLCFLQA